MNIAQGTRTRPTNVSDAWAARLAQRCQCGAGTPPARHDDQILEATTGLWAMFEEATRQANDALAQIGSTERIRVRPTCDGRIYSVAGPDGATREITVTSRLVVANGQCFGGATIGTNQTRAYIYLEPIIAGDQVRWIAPASGVAFTTDVIYDLFLSVFGDDPTATWHLSPISGPGLFDIS